MGDNAQWKIGEVTVTLLIERHTEMTVDFLPTVTDENLARHRDWLYPWALSDEGKLRFVLQAMCLEAGGQRIIVDTCVGPRQLPEIYSWVTDDGSFINRLAAAGFGRDDVDLVICTHLHFDHVGWNTIAENGAWVPTFPRARYLIGRTEYEHWQAAPEEEMASSNVFNLEDATAPLFDAGLVDLVEADHRVNDVLQLVSTPGHSPGHMSVRISSHGENAFITGDLAHHPVQLLEPDWYTLADHETAISSATRRGVIDDYADSGVLLFGTHFPPPSAGYLVTEDGAVRFRPAGV